jgi:hypothetical protein
MLCAGLGPHRRCHCGARSPMADGAGLLLATARAVRPKRADFSRRSEPRCRPGCRPGFPLPLAYEGALGHPKVDASRRPFEPPHIYPDLPNGDTEPFHQLPLSLHPSPRSSSPASLLCHCSALPRRPVLFLSTLAGATAPTPLSRRWEGGVGAVAPPTSLPLPPQLGGGAEPRKLPLLHCHRLPLYWRANPVTFPVALGRQGCDRVAASLFGVNMTSSDAFCRCLDVV